MPALKQKNINLLVREGFEYSTAGKVLNWLLSTGRIIVILTELVVIIAFLSRFFLDKTLNDLSEQNASRRAQIEASAEFEKDFKSIQSRLGIIKKANEIKIDSADLVTTVSQLLPSDINLTSFALDNNHLQIQGVSQSELGIAGLVFSLDTSKKFINTNLADLTLENQSKQLIKFTIKTDLNNQNTNKKGE